MSEWGPRIDWRCRKAVPPEVKLGDWYRGYYVLSQCVIEKRVERLGPENWALMVWFQIRKPRGLTILENLIADLPAPVGPKVDA